MSENLKAKLRTRNGSNDSKKLRASGRVPGVVYGHHTTSKSFDVDQRELEHLLAHHGTGATVNLDLDGEKVFTMLKNVQKNLYKNQLLHIDLQALTAGETVRVALPIHFINKSKVEDSVKIVVEQVHTLDIEVLPKDLIEYYEVDVEVLNEKHSIVLSDLSIFTDERYTVHADADLLIASLTEGGKMEVESEPESDEIPSILEEMARE